jgi:hypothetical protein
MKSVLVKRAGMGPQPDLVDHHRPHFSFAQGGGSIVRGVGATPGDSEASASNCNLQQGGEGRRNMKRAIVAAIVAAGITIGTVGPAFGNPPPPTNGGNGAGHSGQCTGNPDDRPASCH